MNREILAIIAVFAIGGMLIGFAEASIKTPFEYTAKGVEITDFEFDPRDISIILDVEVSHSIGTLAINFEREFFDSQFNGKDDGFTIIADGDLAYYDEILTSSKIRTLQLSLVSGTEQVEIFGTHLWGETAEYELPTEIISPAAVEETDQLSELLDENERLKQENIALKAENKKLDSRIFELENLVSALEVQVKNLNALVLEQVKVIYEWIVPNQ